MHYEEQAENEKPDWFTYELFGGGKEVRVVARRANEKKHRRYKPSPVRPIHVGWTITFHSGTA